MVDPSYRESRSDLPRLHFVEQSFDEIHGAPLGELERWPHSMPMVRRTLAMAVLTSFFLWPLHARAQQDDAVCFPYPTAAARKAMAPQLLSAFVRDHSADFPEFERLAKLYTSSLEGSLEGMSNPEEAVENLLAKIDADVARAECFRGYTGPKRGYGAGALPGEDGTAFADRVHARVDPLRQPLRDALAKELACRADAKCLLPRQIQAVTANVCAVQGEREFLVQRMAAERSNPSGVVDLVELHDDGMSLQDIDAHRLPPVKAAYLKITKKPFSRTVCLPIWEAQRAAEK